MSDFRTAVMTDEGAALLAASVTEGFQLEFVKMLTGSGRYSEEERRADALRQCTLLKELEQEFGFSSITANENTVCLKALLTNEELVSGYRMTEIGIIARKNGTEEEGVLYSIAIAVEADYMPDKSNPIEIVQEYYTKVSNAENVTINIEMGSVALAEDLLNEITRATAAEAELQIAKHTHGNKKLLDNISVVNNTADRDKVVRSLNVCFSESTGTSKKGWCFIIGRAIIRNQYEDNVLIGTIFTCDDSGQTSCSMSYVWRVNQQLSMTESPESAINIINYDGLNPQNLWASIVKNGDSEKYVELWYTTDQIDNRRYGSTVHSVYGNIFVPDSVSLANNAGANKCAVGALTGNVKSAGAIKDSSNNNMITVSNAMDGLTNNDALWLAVFQGDTIRKVNKNVLNVNEAAHFIINDIANGSDLNNCKQAGFYASFSNANTLTLKNCPTKYAFGMVVGRHAGYWQELTEYMTGTEEAGLYPKIFRRNAYGSTWGDRYRVYTEADPPTAENVGALPISGGTMEKNADIIMNGGTIASSGNTLEFSSKTNSGITTKAFLSIPFGGDGGCFSMLYYIGTTSMGGHCDLGTNDRKWRNIYAANGTIQTSDRTKKYNITEIPEEIATAIVMGVLPSTYKMVDGTSGRTHYGLIAQDVEVLLKSLGIDTKDFAGFIKSPKVIRKDTDEDGNLLKEPTEEIVEGEYDYALRYDEFIAPLIKTVQCQQREIGELREELAHIKAKIQQK